MFIQPENPVTVLDMLNHREHRVELQNYLLEKFHLPLISFTLNIPGPIKVSQDTRRAFHAGCQEIYEVLEKNHLLIRDTLEIHTHCGDELLLSVNASTKKLKELMISIEENSPIGRLFDIDVLNENGKKESRSSYRQCLLCNSQAQDCARNRTHSVEELQQAILALIHNHVYK